MWKKFDGPLRSLAPDAALNSSALIKSRLAEASYPIRKGTPTRYTFIPAAVGVTDGYMTISEVTPQQMIRGGAHSDGGGKAITVPVVDVVTWLANNFREQDFIMLKMDVECAEHAILEALLRNGAGHLIDELAWECHEGCPGTPNRCSSMRQKLHVQTKARIIEEGSSGYFGYDSFSSPDKYFPEC